MLFVHRGLLAVLLSLCVPSLAQAASPLRIGMIPDAGATQVSIDQKKPLRDYLESKLGVPVELVIPTNYNATVEALGNGSLDVAYLGGLTYVKARERYGAIPLVQRDIDQRFHSLFIRHVGSGISGIDDLRGRSFCFGDINSTSGHLFPWLQMKNAGISADADLESFRYTGSHPATAQAVATGVCEAGALDETVYRSLVADGKIDARQAEVFFETPAFPDYVWAARKDLDVALQARIADTFLALKSGQDDAVLDILRGKQFVRADDAAYDPVRSAAKELDLL